MYVIKRETTYPANERRDALTVTSYFFGVDMFAKWTPHIEKAKRFHFKYEAKEFMAVYNLERPNSVLSLVHVDTEQQEEAE